jgi:DNA-directed RNA polymerase II subunit RPB1
MTDPNLPRVLTDSEIDDIVDVIPKVYSTIPEIAESIRESIKRHLRRLLYGKKITPLAINDLKQEIVKSFRRCQIHPGTKVGFAASSSIGQLLTQMTLNSFYTSGLTKTITTGVKRLHELIDVSPNPKNPSCMIFFNHKFSYDDIFHIVRPEMCETTVGDLVEDCIIDFPHNIIDQEKDKWWYQLYHINISDTTQLSRYSELYMLRLKINIKAMLSQRVTMSQLASSLIQHNNTVIVVYSPLSVGIVDIYPRIEEIGKSNQKHIESNIDPVEITLMFLTSVFYQNLDKIHVKGIPRIRQIYPSVVKMSSALTNSVKVSNDRWRIYYNPVFMYTIGITLDNLVDLIKGAGNNVDKVSDKYGFIEVISPTEPIASISRSNIGDIVIGETNGSNLLGILGHPWVNYRYTISNNINEVIKVLGIEATRNFLIREYIFNMQLEGTSPVDPRHIAMITEYQTEQGRLIPASIAGIQKQPLGALTKSTFERSMDIFFDEASIGRSESINTVSSSIMIGKKTNIGTNLPIIKPDPKALEEINRRVRDKIKVDPVDFSITLGNLGTFDRDKDNDEFFKEFLSKPTPTTQPPPQPPSTVISNTTTVTLDIVQPPTQSKLSENILSNFTVMPCQPTLPKVSRPKIPSITPFLAKK